MRIIAGKYRGRNLKESTVCSRCGRLRIVCAKRSSTSSRRESKTRVFSISAPAQERLASRRFRAAQVTSPSSISRERCARLVEANLDLCRVPEERDEVVQAEAADYLARRRKQKATPWDIVFFDPPYATRLSSGARTVWPRTPLSLLAAEACWSSNTITKIVCLRRLGV